LEEIAGNFELPPAAVHAAMAYYYDHQSEIDKSLEEDAAFAEAFRKNNPSLLRERLKALTRDRDFLRLAAEARQHPGLVYCTTTHAVGEIVGALRRIEYV
ncbi:MAG: hypothetical protein ACREX4_25025, partial [Gammaproteobacteria bacterium]